MVWKPHDIPHGFIDVDIDISIWANQVDFPTSCVIEGDFCLGHHPLLQTSNLVHKTILHFILAKIYSLF